MNFMKTLQLDKLPVKSVFLQQKAKEIQIAISKDRVRTNLLKNFEQKSLVYLVQKVPSWISSDMLTLIGFCGSLMILLSFILATYISKYYLLLAILGFIINWFGDSLDGRIAYYRNKSRKWYGFSIDLTVDWISTILMGWGYVIYTEGMWEMMGFGFVILYGWAIMTTLIRYKVTSKYTIDSGLLGPTEVRVIISAVLVAEVLFNGAILYGAVGACLILLIININDTLKLLRLASEKDLLEKQENNA